MPANVSGENKDGGYWSHVIASYWATAFVQGVKITIGELIKLATQQHVHLTKAAIASNLAGSGSGSDSNEPAKA